MHPELHSYLDGELERSALSAQAQAELAEWEAIERSVAERRDERAPNGLVADIMAALPEPHTPWWQRLGAWLITPQPIRIPPLAPVALGAAAVLALVLLRPAERSIVPADPAAGSVTTVANTAATVFVQFSLTAEGAQSVAVAGDFNNWSTDSAVLRDPDGDGVWVGLVPVTPGVHKYMFVVDGAEWVTDPRADGYVDDGFGMRNALIAVTPPTRRST